jgi:hypothetical protein
MTIKVGDKLPAGTLQEFFEVEKDWLLGRPQRRSRSTT